jgi:hypothetical protein
MDRRWFEWLREEDARSRAGRLGAAPELRAAVVHERPVADRTDRTGSQAPAGACDCIREVSDYLFHFSLSSRCHGD